MAEILHQLIGCFSHYLQGFIHPRWCRISAINRSSLPSIIFQGRGVCFRIAIKNTKETPISEGSGTDGQLMLFRSPSPNGKDNLSYHHQFFMEITPADQSSPLKKQAIVIQGGGSDSLVYTKSYGFSRQV